MLFNFGKITSLRYSEYFFKIKSIKTKTIKKQKHTAKKISNNSFSRGDILNYEIKET